MFEIPAGGRRYRALAVLVKQKRLAKTAPGRWPGGSGSASDIGAYETLFNWCSKFSVRGSGQEVVQVGAIILDDAHVALSSVREAFTLNISAKDHKEVYTELAVSCDTSWRKDALFLVESQSPERWPIGCSHLVY